MKTTIGASYDEVGRDMIKHYLRKSVKVADLGCNNNKIRDDAIGFDNDLDSNPDVYFDFNKSFEFASDKTYDGISMSHFLEHFPNTRALLLSCYNVLIDHGRIGIVVPDGESVPSNTLGDSDGGHYQLFTEITLKKYLEYIGFKNIVVKKYERGEGSGSYCIFAGGEK